MSALSAFFIPKQRHFGLSIGRGSLRGVEVDALGKVRCAAEVMLPSEVFKDGVLVNKETFVSGIKKLLEVGKFSTVYVSVCFSEAYAFSREFSLPNLPFSEIREAISWNVKELFPFPENEIYFDWKLLAKTDREYKVIVVAVQKPILDGPIEALISAGLKPLGFQPGTAAVSKLLTIKSGQHAIMAEVNSKGAYVTLLEGEKTLFTTVVNYTSGDTADSYLKNTNESITEITNYYKSRGILTQNAPVPVILTGELATDEWVKRSSGQIANPIKILRTPWTNPAFNKAYAAAITGVFPPDDETSINLLPGEIQKRHDAEVTAIFYRRLMTRTCFLLIALCMGSVFAFIFVTTERARIETEVKTLTASVESQKTDTQNLLLLNAQAKNIVALAHFRKTISDKLEVIKNLLPDTVSITSWEYDDASLKFTINGEAQSRADLLTLRNRIDKSGEFGKITLPLESLELAKNVQFTLTFVTKN